MSTHPTLLFEPQSHRTTFAVTGVEPLPATTITAELGYKNATDLYLASDPPRPEELSAALSVVELHLDDVARELNSSRSADDGRSAFDMTVRDATIVGAGPILSNLVAIERGSAEGQVERFELTREAVEDVFRTIATESLEDRLFNPGLDPDWGTMIVGGACIVVETFRCWDLESMTVLPPAPS